MNTVTCVHCMVNITPLITQTTITTEFAPTSTEHSVPACDKPVPFYVYQHCSVGRQTKCDR